MTVEASVQLHEEIMAGQHNHLFPAGTFIFGGDIRDASFALLRLRTRQGRPFEPDDTDAVLRVLAIREGFAEIVVLNPIHATI